MKSDKVIVKNSNIEGLGIFALRNFKKGEIVLHWNTSHILSKEKIDQMSNKKKKYISFLDNKYVIMQEPEKYVNHSCNSNTITKKFCDIAIKNIQAGEEITTDYNKELISKISIKCNCGSKKCKKITKKND